MSGELRFKSYRDQAEMERDAARMEAAGWRLRSWQLRSEADLTGPPQNIGMLETVAWPHGPAVALLGCFHLIAWLVMGILLGPWLLIRGRKKIDAAYERGQG